MTKIDVLGEISYTRLKMRLAQYSGENEKAAMYDATIEKLIEEAKSLKIEFSEIESELLNADEVAEMVNENA